MNFSILKKILARAHFRARALRIFYHLCQKTMIFEFSQRCEIRRAPRAEVRARQKFFGNVIFMIKSRCKFFCLVITQKANFLEQFEV